MTIAGVGGRALDKVDAVDVKRVMSIGRCGWQGWMLRWRGDVSELVGRYVFARTRRAEWKWWLVEDVVLIGWRLEQKEKRISTRGKGRNTSRFRSTMRGWYKSIVLFGVCYSRSIHIRSSVLHVVMVSRS